MVMNQKQYICALTIARLQPKVCRASEKLICRRWVKQNLKGTVIMGDRSPKSVNKQASQKQLKANTANQKKQQAISAKQAANKKK